MRFFAGLFFVILVVSLSPGSKLYPQSFICTVINSKSETLYAGVDNLIRIDMHPCTGGPMEVFVDNGLVFRDSAYINIVPRRSGRLKLRLACFDAKNDSLVEFSKSYLVSNIPEVQLTIGKKTMAELQYLRRGFLEENNEFGLFVSDDIIASDTWMKIEEITVGYLKGGFYVTHRCHADSLNGEILRVIEDLPPGKELSFKVRVKCHGEIYKTAPVFRTILE